jgi:hypothetical protein
MAINFLNTVAVDENVLFVDTVNDRVGIGTASPDYLLDLYKSTATTSSSTGTTLQRLWNYVGSDLNQQKTFVDFVFQDDNDNEYPQVRIGAEVGQNGDSDTQLKEGSGAFVVYTNNATGNGPGTPTGLAERFRVDYKGNVGIGTDSPAAGLQVALGGTTIPAAGASTASAVFGNSTSDDNYGVAIGANSSGVGYISSQRTDGTATTYNLAIQSNGGNVGIGTDSPLTNLHIANSGSAAQLSLERTDTSDTLKLVIGSSYGYLQNTTGPLSLGTIGGTQQVYIATDGDVGINTTTPGSKLDVDGTFGVSDLPFNTDSVSVLVADETIGAELITNGNFATDSDWSKGPGWTISGGTANAVSATSEPMAQTVSGFAAGNIYKVRFEVTAVTNGYIRVYAYVGASGTFTNIFNSSELTTGVYEGTFEFGGTNKILRFYGSTGSVGGFAGSIDNVSVKQVTSASNQIQKRELGTGAFGPTPVGAYLPLSAGSGSPLTGDLYVGTSTAATDRFIRAYFSDNAYTEVRGYGIITNRTGSYYRPVNDKTQVLAIGNDGNTWNYISQNANYHTFGKDTSEWMRIDTSGNVGIGTTDPGANLEIRGTVNTDDCKIYLKENSAYGAYFKYDGDLNRGYIGGITGTTTENTVLSWSRAGSELKLVTSGSTAVTIDSNRDVTFSEDIIINDVLLSNQQNTDIDTGAEVVAQVAHATYTAAFFDFVVKKGTNVRSGTVYACHNGDTTPLVEFTETSTNDLGDTSDVTLSVDISGANMRLLATATSDDWSVKSLIRAI